MVLAQLAKYRLGSSLNGVTTKFEPFLVDISPETFELFAHLINALVEEKEDEQMEGLIEKVKALEDVVKDITQMGDVAYALALKKVVVGIVEAVNHKKEGNLGKKKQGKKREKGMRGIRDIRDWNLAHSTF